MYLRIIDDTITYPYNVFDLRTAYPNISFPETLSNEVLNEWGMYEVQHNPKPIDYTKNITEGTPVLVDGVYYQSWIQTNCTDTEIAYKLENQWVEVREIRNQLLTECDWTQLADIPTETKAVWTEYRTQLRDITSQSNPFSINWPTKP